MTVETHYVAALGDILALRLACKACGAAYSIPPTRTLQPPYGCRVCNAVWFGENAILEREAFTNFQECLKVLLLIAEDASFSLAVELPVVHPPSTP